MKPDQITRDYGVAAPLGTAGATPPPRTALEANGVAHRFGATWALQEVDFVAHEGELVALFGPNGSGKSTLLRILAGLISPARGSVRIGGAPLASIGRRRLAQTVGFLPQVRPALRHVTVHELVGRGRHPHQGLGWVASREDRERVDEALAQLGLAAFADRDVGTLSGGELQRAWLAMVVAQDPKIILLDEPVTFLDMRHQWGLLEVLRGLSEHHGKTIVAVFHDVNHGLAVADRAYLVHEGRIARHGHPEQVITGRSIANVFGVFADVWRYRDGSGSFVVPDGCRGCRRHFQQGLGPREDTP